MRYRLTMPYDFRDWSQAGIGRGVKVAGFKTGKFWHKRVLRRHFESGARSSYLYQPREKRYDISKAAETGRRVPLVGKGTKTRPPGTLKRLAKGIARIKATTTRFMVELTLPRYAFIRARDGAGPNLIREIFALNDRDLTDMIKEFDVELAYHMFEREKRKIVKTSGST